MKHAQLTDLKRIAKNHHLKLVIEEPLQEPLLAIVNLKVRTLSVVSRDIFCEEQGIRWAEDVINAPAPSTLEEKTALEQANRCWKALLQTDYGFGVTNLQEIKSGQYVALYEGYLVDRRNKPSRSQQQSRDYLETLSNYDYVVRFTPTGASSASCLISAQTHRGFGGFMQHLPNEEEMTAYRLNFEFKKYAQCANLIRINLQSRVFLKAKRDIPSLSMLGFSYFSYWYGRSLSPVPFDQRTGLSIPSSGYQIARYYLNFVDTQFGSESYQEYSPEQLQTLGKSDYSTSGDVVFKPEHLKSIHDSETGKIKPPSLYTMIKISDLTAVDYKLVADFYFKGHDPQDINSPEHLQQVIRFYRRAQQLFRQNSQFTQAAECERQMKAYQQALDSLGQSDHLTEQTIKVLLEKYKGKDEKLSTMNKNVAFRRAAAQGHLEDLQQLLQLGAQLNAQGIDSGKTALHQAVIGNHLDVFLFLLCAKANVTLKDREQKTAIDYLKIGSPLHQALALKRKEEVSSKQFPHPASSSM